MTQIFTSYLLPFAYINQQFYIKLTLFDDLTANFVNILIVACYLGILILIAEILSRFYQQDSELTRKIVHIGTGNVILLAWWLKIPTSIILLASIVASLVALASYFLPILPSVNGVGRKSLGTLFYAISIGVLSGLFWENGQKYLTVIGILVMSYGDGLAGLIGKKWGKNPYQLWGNKKSLQGTLTMALVSIIISFILLNLSNELSLNNLIIALIIGFIATFLETFSYIGMDNFTVPVGSAILVFYLQKIIA